MAAWERNADVFPNKGCTGPIDMVLGIENQLVPIDVKAEVWDRRYGTWSSKASLNPDAYVVLVNPVTKNIRWKKNADKSPNCPLGLEDFWD